MSDITGKLFVVTGPSGAGKDSVIEKVREHGLDFGMVTTTSTRPMRPGEAEGQPYYFIDQEEFEAKVDNGDMIEWASVYGNLYGCTRDEVARVRKQNDVVIVKVDPQGARVYADMIEDAQVIFIAPPSIDFLKARLNKRGTEAPEIIAKRLSVAKEEMANKDTWHHVVVNEEGDIDGTARKIIEIMNA